MAEDKFVASDKTILKKVAEIDTALKFIQNKYKKALPKFEHVKKKKLKTIYQILLPSNTHKKYKRISEIM